MGELQDVQASEPASPGTPTGGDSNRGAGCCWFAPPPEVVVATVPDGEHHWLWDDGSEYFGEWRDGAAHGRGVFIWRSGTQLTQRAGLPCADYEKEERDVGST